MPDSRPEQVRAFLTEGTRTAKLPSVAAHSRLLVRVGPTRIIGARDVAS